MPASCRPPPTVRWAGVERHVDSAKWRSANPRTFRYGAGFTIARRLGHAIVPTTPALAPLLLDATDTVHAAVSGVSQEVELSVWIDGAVAVRLAGSLLWTHFGISGPVVMDASRHWTIAHESGAAPTLQCNLLPGESFQQVEQWLIQSTANRHGR